jgi:diguanylate cyclase (GGDEF)-like protein
MGDRKEPGPRTQVARQRFRGQVLLAEDNLVNQEVAIGILTTLGFEVELAENGFQAVRACADKAFDLVLMDCHMPEMDGFDASAEIRQIEKTKGRKQTVIIALTADVQKGVQEQCLAAGMNDYVSKPFNQASLTDILKKWLEPLPADVPVRTKLAQAPRKNRAVDLDQDALRQLREVGTASGRDVLGKAIGLFLQHTPKDVAALRTALAERERDTLRRIAHSLKSASANLGALEISRLCAGLESAAVNGDLAQAPNLVTAIETLLPRTLAALRSEVTDSGMPATDDSAPQSTGNRILLVDDDSNFRFTTAEVLEGAGHLVIQAASGADALSLASQQPPDLVFLDAVMADMDGFEVSRQLLQMRAMRHTPILMVTGLEDIESVNRAFESGATGFITKPVNYTILLHQIRFQLRAARDAKILKESQELLANTQRIAGLGYWRWDGAKDHLTISSNLAAMLGTTVGDCCECLADYIKRVHPEDRDYLERVITEASLGGPLQPIDYRLLINNKPAMTVHQVLDLVTDSRTELLGTVQDISQQRAAQKRIRQLAYSDELTGLASRAYFYKNLEGRIRTAHRRKERFALLYLDLDGFKDVNDSLGHDTGDQLLKIIAQRLQQVLRDTDFVARLSGDEFCILLDQLSDQYAAADVANRCLREINQPADLGLQQIRPRCSIGIAHYPEDGKELKYLLKAADSAMYAAKENGKHRYAFYQPKLTAQAKHRLQLEQDLRLAIDRQELELYYQPQIKLHSGRLIGVEALARWRHPTKGMVPAAEFIAIAERIGVIKTLGEWVLRTACKQAKAWRDMGLPLFKMAVNISPTHFQDPVIVDSVEQILRETAWLPQNLELEVTESVVQTTGDNLTIFRSLRQMGLKIAIDDFGTGYSSLASLKYLPITCLKVDRIFISDMLEDPDSSLLLGTIVGVAHALGHTVVAEGVETQEQVNVLSGISCDAIQGYYISQPVPAKQIPGLVQRQFLWRKLGAENEIAPLSVLN